jgi:hypothetical protein
MRSRSRQHGARREAEQVQDEFIWVLGLDSERVEDSVGKVFEVHGHNDIRPAADGGSKDMAVTGIGEIQAWNQVFIARYKGIQGVVVHQVSRAAPVACGSDKAD